MYALSAEGDGISAHFLSDIKHEAMGAPVIISVESLRSKERFFTLNIVSPTQRNPKTGPGPVCSYCCGNINFRVW